MELKGGEKMYLDFLQAKNDFLKAAHRTYESGIQTGTGGNLSVRIKDEQLMIVKPSGFTLGECSDDNLCIADFDGNLVYGSSKPSRESTLHGSIYKKYPHIGGIVHTHSPYSILCSLFFKNIDLVTMHSALKLKSAIPVADVVTQAVTTEELPKVYRLFDENPDLSAFILKKHGIVSVGKTAVKAGQTCELVEETAKIFWESEKMKKLINYK